MSYSFTTSKSNILDTDYNDSILSGYGFGLPMAKNYCNYLGGNIIINPINGYGTEVLIYFEQ